MSHFSNHKQRDYQRSGMIGKHGQARLVVPIVLVDVGVEGAGVDDQPDPATSAARICSILSETSA